MTTIKEIYEGAARLINELISYEAEQQGHVLDGTMTRSFEGKQKFTAREKILIGEAVKYTQYVNDGVRAKSANFKQAPFLIEYFKKRGFPETAATGGGPTAVQLAFATIKKWQKEGMSTRASARFSKTGARQNMVQDAFAVGGSKIDDFMEKSFDFVIDEHYHLTKSETI